MPKALKKKQMRLGIYDFANINTVVYLSVKHVLEDFIDMILNRRMNPCLLSSLKF